MISANHNKSAYKFAIPKILMQLCCIMTGDTSHIFRLFVQVIFLNISLLLIGIPVIHALHTHVESQEGYLSQSAHNSDDGQACGLCASFARFVPREATHTPSFDFNAPVVLRASVFLQAPDEQICDGLPQGYTSRGPPANFLI